MPRLRPISRVRLDQAGHIDSQNHRPKWHFDPLRLAITEYLFSFLKMRAAPVYGTVPHSKKVLGIRSGLARRAIKMVAIIVL